MLDLAAEGNLLLHSWFVSLNFAMVIICRVEAVLFANEFPYLTLRLDGYLNHFKNYLNQ